MRGSPAGQGKSPQPKCVALQQNNQLSPMFLFPSPRRPHLSFPSCQTSSSIDYTASFGARFSPKTMVEQHFLESAATSYHTSPTSPSDLMGTSWGSSRSLMPPKSVNRSIK